MNRFELFHQIYNFGAFGGKDELVRFEVKRSKVKVTTRSTVAKIYF